MPHQCLKCGHIFEEGSSQLLKGCPDCGGNRFFFTKEPLNEKERGAVSQEVNQDLTSKLTELLVEKNKDVLGKSGKWVSIKPKEIRRMINDHISEEKIQIQKDKGDAQEPIEPINDEWRKTSLEKLKTEEKETPETIDIEKPGKYNIDLKGLLEKEPIVIQKDGTYNIHLPSVFKMIEKKE